MIFSLLFLAYCFGVLGFWCATIGAVRADVLPPLSRGSVLAVGIGWPLVVAAAFAVLALSIVGIVLYGVSEL